MALTLHYMDWKLQYSYLEDSSSSIRLSPDLYLWSRATLQFLFPSFRVGFISGKLDEDSLKSDLLSVQMVTTISFKTTNTS